MCWLYLCLSVKKHYTTITLCFTDLSTNFYTSKSLSKRQQLSLPGALAESVVHIVPSIKQCKLSWKPILKIVSKLTNSVSGVFSNCNTAMVSGGFPVKFLLRQGEPSAEGVNFHFPSLWKNKNKQFALKIHFFI